MVRLCEQSGSLAERRGKNLEYGFVGPFELLLFFAILVVVVGPRRIWRGIQVIRGWVRNFSQRVRSSKAAKQGRGILRGLGNVIAYYNRGKKKK